jgi:hypothetical protein
MKGTDKQIAWATEIRSNVIASFWKFIEDIKAFDGPEEIKAVNIAGCRERIAALNDAEYAGDIIDLFKDIRFTGDVEKDFPKVMAIYNTTRPNTDGQKKILCK